MKLIIKGLLAIISKLPLKVHYFNAKIIAFLVRDVFKYRTKDVLINLGRAFPEKDYSEIKQIFKEFYLHFANLIVESIWFGGCRNPERLRKSRIMEIVNPREIQRLYDISPSVMVMYSHCGNWELYGGIEQYNFSEDKVPFSEDNFCVVYKKMSSATWDEIMRENRFAPLLDRNNFQGYIESKRVVRYAFEHKSDKKIYNMNTDQRPYLSGSDSINCTFLGQKVRTMSSAASLACKFGMAVCFLKMSVAGRGHYKLEYITICDDASKMSVQQIMDKYYELLDAEIREQPSNYLWTHRRWA